MGHEKLKNRDIESRIQQQQPKLKMGHSTEEVKVWFGLDDEGHRTARNVRDLAAALAKGDVAEANLCLDLIARDNPKFAEQVALGRY